MQHKYFNSARLRYFLSSFEPFPVVVKGLKFVGDRFSSSLFCQKNYGREKPKFRCFIFHFEKELLQLSKFMLKVFG